MRRVALLLAILAGISLVADGAPQKRLAVLDFDYVLVRDQVTAVFGTDLDVGRGIRDLLIKDLVRDGTYTIVELKDLEHSGVDALVMGTVTEFGGDKTERKLTLGGIFGASGNTLQLDKVRGAVAIDARIVDLDSGEAIAVSEGHGASSHTAASLLAGLFSEGGLDIGALDFSARDFEKTTLGEAVHSATEQLAAGLIAANNRVRARNNSASGPATRIIAGILAGELKKQKAIGGDDDGIDPSDADLRIGRTVYIWPLPYDLHVRVADLLRTSSQPLFVISDDPRTAELWISGTVRYSERTRIDAGRDARVLVRRLAASLQVEPRQMSQRLAYAEAKGDFDQQDRIAKDLVHKLTKSVPKK